MAVYDNTGVTLTREQAAQAFAQAGWSGEALVKIVAIAGRESSYRTGVHRTNRDRALERGDFGILQINYTHFPALVSAGIIKQPSDLFDPVTNAKAALYLAQSAGSIDKGIQQLWQAGVRSDGTKGWMQGGDPLFGTDINAARQAVQNAQNQGLLGKPFNASLAGNEQGQALSLPGDAKLLKVDGVNYAWFDLGEGVGIFYDGVASNDPALAGRPVETLTKAQFEQRYPNTHHGGNAAELTAITGTYSSYREFWDSIVESVMGQANPAAKDPGVRAVLAMFAGRPDMSEAELQNKLRATEFFQSRTEQQLRWNDLSEAERATQRHDVAVRMAQAWQQYTGQVVPAQQFLNEQSSNDIASGVMTFSQWQENYVKPAAAGIAESPWFRELRGEEETQRQRGVDVENTAGQIKDTLHQWGLEWSEAQVAQWARNLRENRASDDDLMNAIREQAHAKYGAWKQDRNVDTTTAADAWLGTYRRVMERDASLFTPEVQKALTQGRNVWEFEQDLKKSSAWLETKNARAELNQAVAGIGEMFGMVA